MVETVGRVFAAVPLPPEIRVAVADRICDVTIPGRVAPPENWHLTLRFLGTVDEPTYDRFLAGLAETETVAPFPVRLGSLGAFPRPKRATVVWIGVDEGVKQLTRLNEIAEEAAVSAGLSPEERPYVPHLTLARVRPPQDVSELVDNSFAMRWKCDQVVVYQSHTGSGGASYEPLETFTLGG